MARRRRTPAEKKQLSYERDYRDDLWKSDKARRAIPRRKRHRARADRRPANQGFAPGVVPTTIEDGDHLEAELLPARPRRPWQKQPGRPLGQSVAEHLENRASRAYRRVRGRQ